MKHVALGIAAVLAIGVSFPQSPSAQSLDGRTGSSGFVTYSGNGRIERVVRSTPSGAAIYDGRGRIVEVIRRTPSGFVTVDGRGDLVGAFRSTNGAAFDLDLGSVIVRPDGGIEIDARAEERDRRDIVVEAGSLSLSGNALNGVRFSTAGVGLTIAGVGN